MTTLHKGPNGELAIIKGAPESVLPLCRDQMGEAGSVALCQDRFLEIAAEAAGEGYRVLAFAQKRLALAPAMPVAAEVECGLTFLGLVALTDPARPGVSEALVSCRTAGITVSMMTGDHPATAVATARRLGIIDGKESGAVTGAELREYSVSRKVKVIREARVFARVSPEQKYDIVDEMQRDGQFVAMTGDGVNDAPALKQADIGLAMGLKGTDVAREAADAVLLDDNFATIVAAVREGRRIYDNIRKFVKYTMGSNSGEIWTIFLAPFLGLPLPLLPIQILWINLVTDGLPGLALSAEPEEDAIMERPPRPPDESIFAQGMWQHMIWVGLLIGGLSLGAQAWAYNGGSENWQTVVFTVLTLSQLVHALAIRSERQSVFTIRWFRNPALMGAVLLTLGLQMAVVYLEPLQGIFNTSPLTAKELIVCLGLPSIVMMAVEIEKWLFRKGSIYRGGAEVTNVIQTGREITSQERSPEATSPNNTS
jgi:Ca2+-transporting ATPase